MPSWSTMLSSLSGGTVNTTTLLHVKQQQQQRTEEEPSVRSSATVPNTDSDDTFPSDDSSKESTESAIKEVEQPQANVETHSVKSTHALSFWGVYKERKNGIVQENNSQSDLHSQEQLAQESLADSQEDVVLARKMSYRQWSTRGRRARTSPSPERRSRRFQQLQKRGESPQRRSRWRSPEHTSKRWNSPENHRPWRSPERHGSPWNSPERKSPSRWTTSPERKHSVQQDDDSSFRENTMGPEACNETEATLSTPLEQEPPTSPNNEPAETMIDQASSTTTSTTTTPYMSSPRRKSRWRSPERAIRRIFSPSPEQRMRRQKHHRRAASDSATAVLAAANLSAGQLESPWLAGTAAAAAASLVPKPPQQEPLKQREESSGSSESTPMFGHAVVSMYGSSRGVMEDDEESDSGWSDTDDNSLEDDDPLDILEKNKHKADDGNDNNHNADDDDDEDDSFSVHSVTSAKSWSPDRPVALKNPYQRAASSVAIATDNDDDCDDDDDDYDDEEEDLQEKDSCSYKNVDPSSGSGDDESTVMDSPSVQALYRDDTSTATGRITQSSLQLRGTAEQEALRRELMAHMANGQDFWVITVDKNDKTNEDGGYEEIEEPTVYDYDQASVHLEGSDFFNTDNADDRQLVVAHFSQCRRDVDDAEDSSIDSQSAVFRPDLEGYHTGKTDHDEEENSRESVKIETGTSNESIGCASHGDGNDSSSKSKSVSFRLDDDIYMYDVEAAEYDVPKKKEIERHHVYTATGLVCLGLFLLLLLRLWWWPERKVEAPRPPEQHIFWASPTTPSEIANVTATLSSSNLYRSIYHAPVEAPVRVQFQFNVYFNESTEIIGLENQYISLDSPCPTGLVLFQQGAAESQRVAFATLDLVIDGVDASLVVCRDGFVRAASYHVFTHRIVMGKSNYTTTMDLTTESDVVTLHVGSGTNFLGRGTIMLVPPTPFAEFFSLPPRVNVPQPLGNGDSCARRDELVDAIWFTQDVRTMLPSVSWWILPESNPTHDPTYIYVCQDGRIYSRGMVLHSTETTFSDIASSPIPDQQPTTSTIPPELNVTWNALGQDRIGTGLGTAVSISDNGRIMALGSPMAAHGEKSKVSVYRWKSSGNSSSSSSWELLGQVLEGDDQGNGFGQAVALSGDGRTLAVGAHRHNRGAGRVRVYQLVQEQWWEQLGSDIDGLLNEDSFGVSLDISSNGRTVAAGAHGFDAPAANDKDDESSTIRNSGQVRVFTFDNESNDWYQVGSSLVGTGENDNFGYFTSVSIMKDNTTVVAAGARGIDGVLDEAGHVRVYWFKNGAWQPMGQMLDTASYTAGTGRVSLSGDALRIVTGSVWGSDKAGVVSVYEFHVDSGTWNLLGDPLHGLDAEDWFGVSVDISDDGSTVAAGAVFHGNANATNVGEIRVYRYVDERKKWLPVGSILEGIQDGDYWGRSVSLSSDGSVMAGGAYWFNPLSQRGNDGRVRVMTYSETRDD